MPEDESHSSDWSSWRGSSPASGTAAVEYPRPATTCPEARSSRTHAHDASLFDEESPVGVGYMRWHPPRDRSAQSPDQRSLPGLGRLWSFAVKTAIDHFTATPCRYIEPWYSPFEPVVAQPVPVTS